ncbi:hypothetical protein [Streptomyces armeniacus]|uniref:hypothetical protein n=1 Tax=Streptomyces armeniacus TaxID=83291 RepID=UPI001AD848FB|nr:hypothetical protein [Streptomyces armeniacus]
MNPVKAMLWALLALCLGANIAVSLKMENGPMEVLMSVLTGLGVLGAITGLVLLRRVAR